YPVRSMKTAHWKASKSLLVCLRERSSNRLGRLTVTQEVAGSTAVVLLSDFGMRRSSTLQCHWQSSQVSDRQVPLGSSLRREPDASLETLRAVSSPITGGCRAQQTNPKPQEGNLSDTSIAVAKVPNVKDEHTLATRRVLVEISSSVS